MATIAEILAAKKAAASPAGTERKNIDGIEYARNSLNPEWTAQGPAATTPGKPSFRSLVLSAKQADEDAPKTAMDPGFPPKWLTEPRSLSATAGESIDRTPLNPAPEVVMWHQALNSLDTELCVMRDKDEPTVCWLAITRADQLPILLHRLPWLFREAPHIPTAEEPF